LPGDVIEIVNPLSEDQRYLRFDLLPALLELAATFARDEPYRIFEIGHTFVQTSPPAGAPEVFETPCVAWLLSLPGREEHDWTDAGFLTFKGEALSLLRALCGREPQTVTATHPGYHPGKTARLLVDGRDVASIGAVDPRLCERFGVRARTYAGTMRLADLPAPHVPRYAAPSRYPAIARDLALVVAPEIPAMDRGPQIAAGKKSLAVRIVLQSAESTLTDDAAEAQMRAIVASLRERCDAAVRD
jgi:phenylalanyl-tRNA synthetase beta chain